MDFESFRNRIGRENRIYIMPTARGTLFLAMVVVLILTAATYNNNLIFILAFFLFALFVVSMLQTHFNLRGVRLQFLNAEEAFQGDRLALHFFITQKRQGRKRAIRLRARSKYFTTLQGCNEDLSPQESVRPARIDVLAYKRGVHPVPVIILETFFPLGIFRAWKMFRPEGELIIYPKPEARQALTPRAFDSGDQEFGGRQGPDGDFGELKTYRAGESYHQIAWKHYARTGDLYTKVHWGAEDKHYLIPWPVRKENFEQGLSQMSAWVKQAFDENASFEMETPKRLIEPGRGFEHARICWRALARATWS